MWAAIVVALLQVVPATSFLVAPKFSPNYQLPSASQKATVATRDNLKAEPSNSFLAIASVTFAFCIGAFLRPKEAGSRNVAMQYGAGRERWKSYPAYPFFRGQVRDEVYGPEQKRSTRLYLFFEKDPRFMSRFRKQNNTLAKEGLTAYTTGWEMWNRQKQEWKPYVGPESHPDNPYFPAYSSQFNYWGALPARAPSTSLVSVTAPASLAFAGAPRPSLLGVRSAGRSGRCGRCVMKAHKKAATASKNQGGGGNNIRRGRVPTCLQGAAVKGGRTLVHQTGARWQWGANVQRLRNWHLMSKKDGIVQYFGHGRNVEVAVVPWEYVHKKCIWIDSKTLGPKAYEPWMGNDTGVAAPAVRRHIMKLRQEWLTTDEGKAFEEKKAAQKAKRDKYAEQARSIGQRWKWMRSEEGQKVMGEKRAMRVAKIPAAPDQKS